LILFVIYFSHLFDGIVITNSDDTLAGFLAPVSGARKLAPETMTHFAGK